MPRLTLVPKKLGTSLKHSCRAQEPRSTSHHTATLREATISSISDNFTRTNANVYVCRHFVTLSRTNRSTELRFEKVAHEKKPLSAIDGLNGFGPRLTSRHRVGEGARSLAPTTQVRHHLGDRFIHTQEDEFVVARHRGADVIRENTQARANREVFGAKRFA